MEWQTIALKGGSIHMKFRTVILNHFIAWR